MPLPTLPAGAAAERGTSSPGAGGGSATDIKALLSPVLPDIRKMRQLQGEKDRALVVKHTKLHLAAIGSHIEGVTAGKGEQVG